MTFAHVSSLHQLSYHRQHVVALPRSFGISRHLAPLCRTPDRIHGPPQVRAPSPGYKGDFSQVNAGHALTTLGKHIAPLLTATLNPQPARTVGPAAQLRAR